MRFGKTLQQSFYEPWKDHYLDYAKLKSLLREKDAAEADAPPWTDDEEQRFTDELVNIQLDKINAFQARTYTQLDERTNHCQNLLDDIASAERSNHGSAVGELSTSQKQSLEDVSKQLDSISQELSELEKFSRINYTGALKAAKKHDRRRGINYRVRPLVQVRLAALPFNSEDYSPFLYRLSGMYSFVRQQLGETVERTLSNQDPSVVDEGYVSHKYFVHPDNLLEVKTLILRHLPVLLYKPNSIKDMDGSQRDPSITALYFDSPSFTLYAGKLDKGKGSSSLRVRWYDRLADNLELTLEKKTLREGDDSNTVKINVKDKYLKAFIEGEYKMDKTVRRLRNQKGEDSPEAKELEKNVAEIQGFIRQNELEPVLRANYTRTAFQIPGEDRVRISIDTNLTLIREDGLDHERPCRNPSEWHRKDIDDLSLEYPFPSLARGEISRFPYAIMEIKVSQGLLRKKKIEWIEDLMNSHLVKDAPRFSKFLHGVASLFEDYINSIPFWMSLTDTDIRRDPEEAFKEEQDRKAKQAEDEFVVGSLLGSLPKSKSPGFKAASKSPVKGLREDTTPPTDAAGPSRQISKGGYNESGEVDNAGASDSSRPAKSQGLRDLFPSFSNSKYARSRRDASRLPPGIKRPDYFLKDMGEVKVEPKVWLANQRTFIKYQHISVLLAVLGLGLFNAAGPENTIASILAVVYTLIALLIAAWGWFIYNQRSRMIEQRSGKDFDNVAGPIVISLSLIVALCLNFGFKFHSVVLANGGTFWLPSSPRPEL